MPNTISFAVTPRVCADAGRDASVATATAVTRPIVDLCICSSLNASIVLLANLGIHAVDHPLVLLVHEPALELHRGCELVVLGGELLLDQPELLDRLDPGEVAVHPLDLRPDQVVDLARSAERGEIG